MKHIGILFLLFCSVAANSQGLDIEVKLDQAAGKKVFLANYYLGNIYTKDTIQLDSEGMGVFKTDSLLPQGLYKIYMDKDHHFDFLL
ncbi:MAG: hypothetical protein ACOCWK_05490, partial [Tangfeifania sp.]